MECKFCGTPMHSHCENPACAWLKCEKCLSLFNWDKETWAGPAPQKKERKKKV